MKIWIDLANTPQVQFFRPLIGLLEKQGHNVVITTRSYAQTVQLADRFGLNHTLIGSHGGRGLKGLIQQNFLRSLQLRQWAKDQKFDLAVSHNSYSQAVAAFLLRIPSVTFMDYEHQPLNHLCFRLARRVVVPHVFPNAMLEKFGARGKTYKYDGLKEEVYIADFQPSADFRTANGFPQGLPLVVVRPPAPWTAYHRFENDLFDELLKSLSVKENVYLLFLPRLASQRDSVKDLPSFHVSDQVYDGLDLIYHADAVFSGGGTINREAAVLGTMVYTIFKGKLGAVDQYLIDGERMKLLQTVDDLSQIEFVCTPKQNSVFSSSGLPQQLVDLMLG